MTDYLNNLTWCFLLRYYEQLMSKHCYAEIAYRKGCFT